MPATKSRVGRAKALGDPPVPPQRRPPATEDLPVREVSARRRPSAARWVIPGLAGTAVVASQAWLLTAPLLNSSSVTRAAPVGDCVPQQDLFDVRAGMTRQEVVDAFSSEGRINEYTPRQSLEVIHRSCARTAPWTRLLWISYVWEQGEWRVAGMHKGLGIVDAG